MQTRKEYIDKMATQLKEWDENLIQLQQKLKDSSDDIKTKYNHQIDDLKTRLDSFKNNYMEVKTSTGKAFDDMMGGFKHAADDLGEGFKKALAEFKNEK